MNSHTLSINSKPFFPSMQSTSLDNHHENQNLGSNNIHHGNHTKAQSSSTLDQQLNNQEKLNKKQNRKKGNMKSEEMHIRNNELKESNMENANVINNISQNRKQSKRIKGTQNSQTPIPNHSFMTTTQTQSELSNALDRVHAHQYSQNFPSVNASISSTSSSTITPVPFSYKDILQSKTSGILTNSEILPQKSVVVAAHSNNKQQHISKQPVLDVINNNTINSSTPTPQTAATQTKELKSEKKANQYSGSL
ncbi:hypothetical protein C9374_014349 [Naegleria lovaniensis]|uniref:Uncharacterized protein n=1 Tax=Naegleria lovaniensis TaxID=51637 RepID=A0AA88GZQ7_NAELO|nr:uncharacterized protein C9374_014349 [Naegleria lovaniensis]KAG2388949.1 hypothetical protein C9374_014349 [Naegleria lovaniensis]